MNLQCIGDILNVQIPSLTRNAHVVDWYRSAMTNILPVAADVEKEYATKLPSPYNDILKYFNLVITNCVHLYFNEFRRSYLNSQSADHQKFLVDKYLNREVLQKITDTAEIISKRNFQWENHGQPGYQKDREVIFILQMIKFNLIWLYLEIRIAVENTTPAHYHTLETLLAQYFHEYNANSEYIEKKQ